MQCMLQQGSFCWDGGKAGKDNPLVNESEVFIANSDLQVLECSLNEQGCCGLVPLSNDSLSLSLLVSRG